ncbi:MAG TPA: DUF389 domain-containing protein [Conexibacter sp.]|nr:DUF389 domain-containing protein [Conexibacter sp.]
MPSTAIVWLRRDLRVHDHPPLVSALAAHERVVPVFVLDPVLLRGRFASGPRTAFRLECLRELDDALRARAATAESRPATFAEAPLTAARSPGLLPAAVMLLLRLSVPSDRAFELTRMLDRMPGVHRLVATPALDQAVVVVTGEVDSAATDSVVDAMHAAEVPPANFMLGRLDVVAPSGGRKVAQEEFSWYEVLGEARRTSYPFARYFTLMAVAGAIASVGVMENNGILIVGAMAVSPDLLPVCAMCVGLVGRRWRLAWRSFTTLALGLLFAAVVAGLFTALLDVTDLEPQLRAQPIGGIGTLVSGVDQFTVLIALAAGIAGMLSFQTRASAAVGVAISVTTIPASAFVGVAIALGIPNQAWSALAVLGINVAALALSGTATLLVERRAHAALQRRHAHR